MACHDKYRIAFKDACPGYLHLMGKWGLDRIERNDKQLVIVLPDEINKSKDLVAISNTAN